MKSIKRSLIKSNLLINKKTFTDKQSPIVRIGNNFYIYRILYILSRGNLNNDSQNNKATFYLKTKMIIKKDMDYAKPSEKEIIIESYKSLIVYISDFCQIKDMNSYKIIIFNSHLQTIDGNDQLMNYKDKILYAKIKENINIKKVENEDNIKYNIFKSIKNLSNRRLYAINHRDDKGNVNRHNKTIFSYAKNSFQTLKSKGSSNFNKNMSSQSLKKTLDKNTSLSVDLNTNNKGVSKIFFEKKLSRVSLKFNRDSFELRKDENDLSNSSLKFSQDFFSDFSDKDYLINKLKNTQIKNSLTRTKFISHSQSDYFKFKNQRMKSKESLNDKKFNSLDKSKNSKSIAVQVAEMEKSFNSKKNYIYNNFFNNIIKRHNYSALLKRKKNNSMLNLKKMDNKSIYNSKEEKSPNESNSIFNKKLFLKNSSQFSKLKTIFKYLKYPKLIDKSIEFNKEKEKEKEVNILSLNKLKEIYDECLYEINLIINDINDYFPDITDLIEQNDIFFKNKYKNIDISRCLKQYLLYSFLENFINEDESLSLNSLIFLIDEPITEENYNDSEKLLEFLSQKILKTKENTNFDLIEYVQSKRRLKEYKISKKFFFIFILCTNFFDKMQRDISKRMLMSLEIENFVNFKSFANYYIYFKDNQSLNIENKLNFITKFLYIVDSGCNEDKDPEVIQKFKNDMSYAFKIDERTKIFLLGNIQVKNLSYILAKKINDVFANMIKYYNNNFFKTETIANLN